MKVRLRYLVLLGFVFFVSTLTGCANTYLESSQIVESLNGLIILQTIKADFDGDGVVENAALRQKVNSSKNDYTIFITIGKTTYMNTIKGIGLTAQMEMLNLKDGKKSILVVLNETETLNISTGVPSYDFKYGAILVNYENKKIETHNIYFPYNQNTYEIVKTKLHLTIKDLKNNLEIIYDPNLYENDQNIFQKSDGTDIQFSLTNSSYINIKKVENNDGNDDVVFEKNIGGNTRGSLGVLKYYYSFENEKWKLIKMILFIDDKPTQVFKI